MDLSEFFNKCKLYTAERSTEEMFDKGHSAVYAFYDRLHFQSDRFSDSIDDYKTKYGRFIDIEKEKWPFELKINFRGSADAFKGEGKRLAGTKSVEALAEICSILEFLSIINEPLYLGKTKDVKVRFVAHHDNGFLYKMKKDFKRPPSEFLFFVFYCPEEQVRLIESILIQTINPPHCVQKS